MAARDDEVHACYATHGDLINWINTTHAQIAAAHVASPTKPGTSPLPTSNTTH